MKPELTPLRKLKDMVAFMNLPVYSYLDSDYFAFLKIHEMGLQMPYLTPIFRPDFYSLIIVKEGKGTFVTGDQVFELGSRHVFMQYPDIHFTSGWTELVTVYSINFTREFLTRYFHNGIGGIPLKDELNGLNYCLDEDDFNQFEDICLEIYKESVSSSFYKYEMIANLLYNIVLLIQHHQSKIKTKIYDEKSAMILASFLKNIDENFSMLISGENSVVLRTKEHAKMLNLTETYLSKVVSKNSGKTINQWINARLIDEISYLLKHTDRPIAEIAEMFAFSDLKSLNMFFKKNNKNTPTSIRNDFNNSITDGAHFYRGDLINIRTSW
jgi:AraC family transcriptional activator of pobA